MKPSFDIKGIHYVCWVIKSFLCSSFKNTKEIDWLLTKYLLDFSRNTYQSCPNAVLEGYCHNGNKGSNNWWAWKMRKRLRFLYYMKKMGDIEKFGLVFWVTIFTDNLFCEIFHRFPPSKSDKENEESGRHQLLSTCIPTNRKRTISVL